jgi:hypothetical protein
MTRHVKIIVKKTFDGNVETDPTDTMAKAVFATVDGKTLVGLSICKFGQNPACIVVFDDA